MSGAPARRGPPPLAPFGLVLHHDGRWSHEGAPIRNRRLREKFDRSVRYLPDEEVYVVQVGPFRGQIELEEAGFFVRQFAPETGVLSLSDGSVEPLDVSTLSLSPRDGALRCRVKRALAPLQGGLLARFDHSAHADFMQVVVEREAGFAVEVAGQERAIPEL